MKKLLLVVALGLSSAAFSQQYSKVKVYANDQELGTLASMGLPVDHGEHKKNTYLVSDFSEREIEILDQSGIPYEVVIKDVKAYYAAQSTITQAKNNTCAGAGGNNLPAVPANFETNVSNYAGFYTYQQMLDELDDMATQYPNLITVKAPISTFLTWEGRPIYHVKISDNPSTNEAAETKVLHTAIHHAREPMSMSQTIFYMWYLLENYATNEEIQFLVNNTELYFVPCLNPDGYIHNETNDPNGFGMHRKNKRPVGTTNPGVDLNRNYSYGWGTTGVNFDPNNDTYPGGPNDGNDYSFSEPETQAMKWLVEQIGFTSAFNAHTYGNLLLYPIGTTNNEFADHHDYFVDLCGHMVSQNGYLSQKSSGLYPASGDSDDYMYKVDIGVGNKDTIFAFTPEIGTSFWPSQSAVIPTCQEMVFPNMVLSHMTHRYYVVKDADPGLIGAMSGNFNHDIQRLGLEDGSVTVSIEGLLNIQSVGSPVVYDLSRRESASGTISYSLNPSINSGDEIKYILKTEYPTWTHRDTITKTYGSIPLAAVEDGSSTANWTGAWITTGSTFVSPSQSFTDGNGDYSNNASKTYTYVPSIDLTNATQAMISFYAKWEIETDYDYTQFQVSTDGGNTWIGQCGNYTVPGIQQGGWNSGVQPDGEPIWEGTQANWVLEEISLSDYLGQTIKVRFILESDGGTRQDGFYFDDFSIFIDGTSGLNDIANSEVKVFPNPSNKEAIVSVSTIVNQGEVRVINQMGQVVQVIAVNEKTQNIHLSTAELAEGIYMITIVSGDEFSVPVKLVVKH